MVSIYLALLLSASTDPRCHLVKRHRAEAAAFRHEWSKANGGLPCPLSCQTFVLRSGKHVKYERCGACAVDHKCALACWNPVANACGPDDRSNMHWMDKLANGIKRDDCSACPAPPAVFRPP